MRKTEQKQDFTQHCEKYENDLEKLAEVASIIMERMSASYFSFTAEKERATKKIIVRFHINK